MNLPRSIPPALAAFALVAVLHGATLPRTAKAAEDGPAVVVELFTSQGCSSCPPADDYLGELAARENVVALSYHVDYWDYIGWADPFADAAYTARQRAYGRQLDQRYVYTPQMVIDGRVHEVGSRRSAVEARIEAARMKHQMRDSKLKNPPHVALSSDGGDLIVAVEGSVKGGALDILLVDFDDRHETPVRRGENGGRTLVNHHVVRGMKRLGEWSGGKAIHRIARTDITGDGGCAVILQAKGPGPVLAADTIRF